MKLLSILILGIPVCLAVDFAWVHYLRMKGGLDLDEIRSAYWHLVPFFYLFWLAGTLYYFS